MNPIDDLDNENQVEVLGEVEPSELQGIMSRMPARRAAARKVTSRPVVVTKKAPMRASTLETSMPIQRATDTPSSQPATDLRASGLLSNLVNLVNPFLKQSAVGPTYNQDQQTTRQAALVNPGKVLQTGQNVPVTPVATTPAQAAAAAAQAAQPYQYQQNPYQYQPSDGGGGSGGYSSDGQAYYADDDGGYDDDDED